MNEKNKKANCISLDLDVTNPLGRGMTYGYAARVPIDMAVIVKIVKSDMRGVWKWIACTCAATDLGLCMKAATVNLSKLAK